jgi:hypothetical protein
MREIQLLETRNFRSFRHSLARQSIQPRKPSPASRDAVPHFNNDHGGDIDIAPGDVPPGVMGNEPISQFRVDAGDRSVIRETDIIFP